MGCPLRQLAKSQSERMGVMEIYLVNNSIMERDATPICFVNPISERNATPVEIVDRFTHHNARACYIADPLTHNAMKVYVDTTVLSGGRGYVNPVPEWVGWVFTLAAIPAFIGSILFFCLLLTAHGAIMAIVWLLLDIICWALLVLNIAHGKL